MGRKVYGSGYSASDLADDRPRSGHSSAAVLAPTVGAPAVDDEARALAVKGIRRRCPDPDLILDVLGLAPKPVRAEVQCPTCGAVPGAQCFSTKGTRNRQPHIARRRLVGRIQSTEGEAE